MTASVAPMGDASRALTIALAEPGEVQQTAYLFDMQPEVEGQGITLAVPHQSASREERPAWLCGISSALELPSNVQSVCLVYDAPRADFLSEHEPSPAPIEPSPEPRRMPGAMPHAEVETATKVQSTQRMTPRVGGEQRSIRLVVEKRVPLVGWVLLSAALLASQSAGLDRHVDRYSDRYSDRYNDRYTAIT